MNFIQRGKKEFILCEIPHIIGKMPQERNGKGRFSVKKPAIIDGIKFAYL